MDIRIKHILKLNPIVSMIGYYVREKRATARIKKFDDCPTQQNKILFATTEGRFNDSCCVIAEYLHTQNSNIEMVWACRDPEYINEIPSYIKVVMFETKEYYRELATSSTWIFNFLIPQGTIKRTNQLYIQVWHGDKPLKKIGNEAAKASKGYRNRTKGRKFPEQYLCDYFMTGSASFVDIWKRSVGYNGKVVYSGLPRNDILLHPQEADLKSIRSELGIDDDAMVMLYAPTFRDHKIDSGNIGTNIDLNKILTILEKKYRKKWICLKRAHGGKSITLGNTSDSKQIIDVTKYRDMTNLLLISDFLITDYSSCAGDFAYLNRPVILYQDDYAIYTTLDRGLVFDIRKTPFYRAENMMELRELIFSLEPEAVTKNCKEILNLYQSTQTSHSTEDISRIVLAHMNL